MFPADCGQNSFTVQPGHENVRIIVRECPPRLSRNGFFSPDDVPENVGSRSGLDAVPGERAAFTGPKAFARFTTFWGENPDEADLGDRSKLSGFHDSDPVVNKRISSHPAAGSGFTS